MTTKAQLRKAALSLPGTSEAGTRESPEYLVDGRVFAALHDRTGVRLFLDEATVRQSLGSCTVSQVPTADGEPGGVSVSLEEVNGMELNNLVFKSWLVRAPAELEQAARASLKGTVTGGPDTLPPAIGKPATRALLLAGIKTLQDAAGRSERELLALHGVGPRAVGILKEALKKTGRAFTEPSPG